MAIPATQIRRGMVIVFEGQPCKVVEFRHHTPGNLRAMVQTKLRNIKTGSSFEHRFRSADTIERATLEQHEMEYLYSDGSHHHFMNTENFEQIALSEDELGDAAQWLSPGLRSANGILRRRSCRHRPAAFDGTHGHAHRADNERRDSFECKQTRHAREWRHDHRASFC